MLFGRRIITSLASETTSSAIVNLLSLFGLVRLAFSGAARRRFVSPGD